MTRDKLLELYATGCRKFPDADLSHMDFTDCDLSGIDLRRAILHRARFCNANLSHADLRNVTGSGVDLQGACLYGALLAYANLPHATMDNADLRYLDAFKAMLLDAHMRGADLDTACFDAAWLLDAYFQGANLKHANFSNALLANSDLVWRAKSPSPAGHMMLAWTHTSVDTWIIHAGCRTFTLAEAREHWARDAVRRDALDPVVVYDWVQPFLDFLDAETPSV